MPRAPTASRVRSLLLALIVVAWPAASRGQRPRATDGAVLRVDGDQVYFVARADAGLRAGQVIPLTRTISARHPVTGEELVDHLPLGSLTVEVVGEVMAVGRVDPKVAAVVRPGDVVRLGPGAASRPPPRRPAPPAQAAIEERPPPPAAPEEPEAPARPAAAAPEGPGVEMGRVFQSTLGRTAGERVEILERYRDQHPGSPFLTLVSREIDRMRMITDALDKAARLEPELAEARRQRAAAADQLVALEKAQESARVVQAAARRPVSIGRLPLRVYEGDPVEATIYVTDPALVAAAFLYLRRPADLTFRRVPLERDGDGYYRGQAPPEAVLPPGFEAFLEVVAADGTSEALQGSAATPGKVEVAALPVAQPFTGPGHSSVRGFFEYVDFNRFRGNDYYLLGEADFLYRVGGIFYSVSTGVGVLNGRGGRKDVLDNSPPDSAAYKGDAVGLNYGYLEAELRFHRLFSMAGRVLGGQSLHGAGVGGELKLRIGPELGTNLVLGGSILSDIGALGQLKLEWDVIRGWPMSASVIVSNQPAWSDVGVRLVYQVGWRVLSWFQPALRVGYDVRDVNHGGLSLGLGLVMSW